MDQSGTGKFGRIRPTVLLLTNLYNQHEAEDIYLSRRLREHFNVALSNPLDCEAIEDDADLILVRNTWPNFDYKEQIDEFKARVVRKGLLTYNPFTGKGDFRGKGYLVELYRLGYPVIPSADELGDLSDLPETDMFFAKPKYKCDNIETFSATREQLSSVWLKDYIIQPYIDFTCEISFYFIDGQFVYAFTTRRKVGDHDFTEYRPTEGDLAFARKFLEWDNMECGLQRVDACRTRDGMLQLVELEDLDPFLYLLRVSDTTREKMVDGIVKALHSRLGRAIR